MKIIHFFLLLLVSFSALAQNQDIWTLEQCIAYAQANNLGVQQNKLQFGTALINEKQARQAIFPNVNASVTGGLNFGRTIDPTSNTFNTEQFGFGNYSLGSDVVLFQGGQLRNNIKKARSDVRAAEKSLEQTANDLALNIANQYLNVLLSQERLNISVQSKQNIQLQFDQLQKLVKAGARAEADLFDMKVQLAQADEGIVLSENTLDLAWLSLKQSMRIDYLTPMALNPLSEDELNQIALNIYSYENLFATAQTNQPGLESAKWNYESARYSEKMAKGAFYPSLFLRGSIGSRFSDAARVPTEFSLERKSLPGIFIDDRSVKYEYTDFVPTKTKLLSFSDQYDLNLNYGVGVNLNIPIYNNFSNWGNAKKAKLAVKIAENQYIIAKENLGQQVAQAIANCKASLKAYDSAKNTEIAATEALIRNQKRYEIGSASNLELSIAQNNADTARLQSIIAKYNLYFNQKLLDFYAGKKIK